MLKQPKKEEKENSSKINLIETLKNRLMSTEKIPFIN